ncbi:NERD domain-containing protein [Demequina sp. TTPB684]|uniref:nuclease-related domain-containing protein n=1 Tax=unclassified Demequina TaxID=2620311 RepID=UPI001CF338F5|nr:MULTISPECIES: nuclease-related domain-containing protein [unclassified Demequina]MCB2413076.1 NERD domain-containing protein [Demequina sp. TTPB684]UPU88116.1 NERD domain-containing protein [Demequina sp. TMPB413]
MTDIVITPWKRYGHHRGYAALQDGTKLGWIDVPTGTVELEDGAERTSTETALTAWRSQLIDGEPEAGAPAGLVEVVPAPAPEHVAPKAPLAVDRDWVDLADNVPGQGVRQKAAEEWERQKRIGNFLAFMGRVADADTEERAWRKGAEGEEVIGAALDKMRKRGWRILHSIPTGEQSDIDHLAIGPGGIVLFNSKRHKNAKIQVRRGGIYVNGGQTTHVLQIRNQVKLAAKKLSKALGRPVHIQGCIAIHNGGINAPDVTFSHHFDDVWVATRWNVTNGMKRADPVLTDAEVEEIYTVARRSTTWLPRA